VTARAGDGNTSASVELPVLASLGDQGLSYMLRGVGHGEGLASFLINDPDFFA
jgi:hypothetical protein